MKQAKVVFQATEGRCQWCHRPFPMIIPEVMPPHGVIPPHRNPGDKYDCPGSMCLSEEDKQQRIQEAH